MAGRHPCYFQVGALQEDWDQTPGGFSAASRPQPEAAEGQAPCRKLNPQRQKRAAEITGLRATRSSSSPQTHSQAGPANTSVTALRRSACGDAAGRDLSPSQSSNSSFSVAGDKPSGITPLVAKFQQGQFRATCLNSVFTSRYHFDSFSCCAAWPEPCEAAARSL